MLFDKEKNSSLIIWVLLFVIIFFFGKGKSLIKFDSGKDNYDKYGRRGKSCKKNDVMFYGNKDGGILQLLSSNAIFILVIVVLLFLCEGKKDDECHDEHHEECCDD